MTVEIERPHSVSDTHVSFANSLAPEKETQTGSARGPAFGEDRFVIFDSDADTGDSVGWDRGFFQAGTALWQPLRPPTSPRRTFTVYISRGAEDHDRSGLARVRGVPLHFTCFVDEGDAAETPSTAAAVGASAREVVDVATRLATLKDTVGLPVLDLAQMIGLRRRRFYDLLDGQDPDPDRVGVIFAVTDAASRVADRLGNRKKTASALLAPVLDGRSFFEVASETEDADSIRRAGEELLERLGSGAVIGRRPAPSAAPREPSERTSARFTNAMNEGDG